MRVEDARTDTIFKQTGGERTMSSGAGVLWFNWINLIYCTLEQNQEVGIPVL